MVCIGHKQVSDGKMAAGMSDRPYHSDSMVGEMTVLYVWGVQMGTPLKRRAAHPSFSNCVFVCFSLQRDCDTCPQISSVGVTLDCFVFWVARETRGQRDYDR